MGLLYKRALAEAELTLAEQFARYSGATIKLHLNLVPQVAPNDGIDRRVWRVPTISAKWKATGQV